MDARVHAVVAGFAPQRFSGRGHTLDRDIGQVGARSRILKRESGIVHSQVQIAGAVLLDDKRRVVLYGTHGKTVQREIGRVEGLARSERAHLDIHAVVRGVLIVDAEGVVGIVRIHRDAGKDGIVLSRHGEVRRHRVGTGLQLLRRISARRSGSARQGMPSRRRRRL